MRRRQLLRHLFDISFLYKKYELLAAPRYANNLRIYIRQCKKRASQNAIILPPLFSCKSCTKVNVSDGIACATDVYSMSAKHIWDGGRNYCCCTTKGKLDQGNFVPPFYGQLLLDHCTENVFWKAKHYSVVVDAWLSVLQCCLPRRWPGFDSWSQPDLWLVLERWFFSETLRRGHLLKHCNWDYI
jgi:hypothetical protein